MDVRLKNTNHGMKTKKETHKIRNINNKNKTKNDYEIVWFNEAFILSNTLLFLYILYV